MVAVFCILCVSGVKKKIRALLDTYDRVFVIVQDDQQFSKQVTEVKFKKKIIFHVRNILRVAKKKTDGQQPALKHNMCNPFLWFFLCGRF